MIVLGHILVIGGAIIVPYFILSALLEDYNKFVEKRRRIKLALRGGI